MNNRVITFIFSILLLTIILVAIDKCSTNHSLKESSDMETKAVEAAEDYKALALMFRDTANYWKRQALKSDSLRLMAVKSGAERRDKIRSLPKEEKKRIADSSFSDVHEWALICADSLKQAKNELELCDSGRIAVDSANHYLTKSNDALTLRGDTLQFALGQKDIQIEFWKKQAGKKFWSGFKWGFGVGIGVGSIGTLLIVK